MKIQHNTDNYINFDLEPKPTSEQLRQYKLNASITEVNNNKAKSKNEGLSEDDKKQIAEKIFAGKQFKRTLTITDLDSFYAAFKNDDDCLAYFEAIHWKIQKACPHCGNINVYAFKTNKRMHKCSGCHTSFNARAGTIFDDSRIPVRKWFLVLYFECNIKGGLSGSDYSTIIGVSKSSILKMLRKIKKAAFDQNLFGFGDNPENTKVMIDFSFHNAKAEWKRKNFEKKNNVDKYGVKKGRKIVMTMIGGNGVVKSILVKNNDKPTVNKIVQQHIPIGSIIVTDEGAEFNDLTKLGYKHFKVKHKGRNYKNGKYSTNRVEGYHANMRKNKRKHGDMFPDLESFELFLDAMSWEVTTCKLNPTQKFNLALLNISRNATVSYTILETTETNTCAKVIDLFNFSLESMAA